MKLITNGVDSAASDLQLTILDAAADLPDKPATGKSSEMSTEVTEKPSVGPLMNGQSKNTLKETEKLLTTKETEKVLTTNGFSKSIQVKGVQEATETPEKEGPEKSPKIFDDVFEDEDFALELPPVPSEEGEKEGQEKATQSTTSTEDDDVMTNGDDGDTLKESAASTNEVPSIENVVEEISTVSFASVEQEIPGTLGLDDTTLNKDELGKEASSSSNDDKLDDVVNDVDIIKSKTDELELEKRNDNINSQTVTTSDDSRPAEATESVTTENEQLAITILSGINSDNNCTETNLSDIIVTEVIIENESDISLFNSTTDVCQSDPLEESSTNVCKSEPPESDTNVCKTEPQESETDAFMSGENETENNDDTIGLAQNVKSENERTENFEDSNRHSSETDDEVIEDPLQDPLDTSFEQSDVEANIVLNDVVGSCDSINNAFEELDEVETVINPIKIIHCGNKESKIIKQTGEPEVNSNGSASLFKLNDKETEEQNESEEAMMLDDEMNRENTQITKTHCESITTGVQNPIKILRKKQIVTKLVEGTSRKRVVPVDRDDDDDDDDDDEEEEEDDSSENDSACPKRIKLSDESSTDDSTVTLSACPKRIKLSDESSTDDSTDTFNCGQIEEDVATATAIVIGCITSQNEKRSTDDELSSDDIKRIRLNSDVLSTCEMPETCDRISNNETVVDSVRLDRDKSQEQVKREHCLVPTIKQEREDLPDETFSETLVPPLLTNADVKCEQIETVQSVEAIKKEVVYDLVGYRSTDVETSDGFRNTGLETSTAVNVENVRVKVERGNSSVTETDKTPNRSEVRNDISSSQISKKKISTLTELVRKKTDDPKKTVSKDKNETSGIMKSATSEDGGGNKKTASNLDAAIERVVQGAKANPEKRLPLLIKFHKDQLKKLTKTDLEELIVQKLCEAITERSAVGELRLRCQNLEQINDQWRKKAIQLEKQNRELEMVLKKYLTEAASQKKDRHPIPVKVTRSVGLQVILSSAIHGTLENARLKAAENLRQQQQNRQMPGQQQQNRQPVVRNNNQNTTSQNNNPNNTPQSSQAQNKVVNPEIIDLTDKEVDRSKQQQQPPPPPPPKQAAPQQKQVPQQKQIPQQKPQAPQQNKQPQQAPPGKTSPQQPQVQQPQKQQQQQQAQKVQQSKQQQGVQARNVPLPNGVRFAQPQQVNTNSPQQLRPPVQNIGGNRPPPPPPAININNNTVLLRGGQPIRVQTPAAGIVRNSPPAYAASTSPRTAIQQVRMQSPVMRPMHPAPLPPTPHYTSSYKSGTKLPPPKPQLKISKTTNGSGIQLSWSMSLTKDNADIVSYQLYAYQEGPCLPNTNLWKKVGDVKALPLPMACTLTQFVEGNKYHFAVRAVDTLSRCGPFSLPGSILLSK